MTRANVPDAPAEYNQSHQTQVATAINTLAQTSFVKGERTFIGGNTNTQIVLIDSSGGKWLLGVNTSGVLTTVAL